MVGTQRSKGGSLPWGSQRSQGVSRADASARLACRRRHRVAMSGASATVMWAEPSPSSVMTMVCPTADASGAESRASAS
jgi:hypothetical protein